MERERGVDLRKGISKMFLWGMLAQLGMGKQVGGLTQPWCSLRWMKMVCRIVKGSVACRLQDTEISSVLVYLSSMRGRHLPSITTRDASQGNGLTFTHHPSSG